MSLLPSFLIANQPFRYTRSLQALSHVLILAPQNPFHALHFAETAYTASDVHLAIRYFLRTIELSDSEEHGVTIRAWYGVKLVSVLPRFIGHLNLQTVTNSLVCSIFIQESDLSF